MKVKGLTKAKRLSKAKRSSKAKPLPLDMISALPQTITEIILCLLPIDEAARTSILSKEWRYKWTKIPKLVFSYAHYGGQIMETDKLLCAIHQVMLQRQDPIHEFTLAIDEVDPPSKTDYPYHEIDKIILHLSRNHTIKKLKLIFEYYDNNMYSLPLSVFSLHHLTELHLCSCDLDHQPIANGFGSLISLSLNGVIISRETLLHFLSKCPLLKSFSLPTLGDNPTVDERSTMSELFECLPMIEHLTLWSDVIPWFVPDLVPQELPTSIIHLKSFRLEGMSFHDGYGLTFLSVLMKNSPNLEKIELEIDTDHYLFREIDYDPDVYEEYHSDVWLEHLSDVWLENLNELKITDFSNLEPEMDFVKFILARSPKLKKAHIRLDLDYRLTSELKKDLKLEILTTLLRAPRASGVEIHV